MKAQTVETRESTGRILCCTVFRPGGKKLLARGHMISEENIRLLETQRMRSVWVTELEEGEVAEQAQGFEPPFPAIRGRDVAGEDRPKWSAQTSSRGAS